MPDPTHLVATVSAQEIALRLGAALLLGCVVAIVCRLSIRRSSAAAFPLIYSLVLLPVLVAMTTIVIADNVARAFGLVGALSIVRFRTVVDDTRDTVFIVFAVAAGMAAGAGDTTVWLLGVPVVGVAAIAASRFCRPKEGSAVSMRVEVRLGLGHDAGAVLVPVISRHARRTRLTGLATAREGTATDCRYEVLLVPQAVPRLAAALRDLEPVQRFEILEA